MGSLKNEVERVKHLSIDIESVCLLAAPKRFRNSEELKSSTVSSKPLAVKQSFINLITSVFKYYYRTDRQLKSTAAEA